LLELFALEDFFAEVDLLFAPEVFFVDVDLLELFAAEGFFAAVFLPFAPEDFDEVDLLEPFAVEGFFDFDAALFGFDDLLEPDVFDPLDDDFDFELVDFFAVAICSSGSRFWACIIVRQKSCRKIYDRELKRYASFSVSISCAVRPQLPLHRSHQVLKEMYFGIRYDLQG
jgi:hypothetical protein